MKKAKTSAQNIVNRRARFDYELGEEIVAGMSLRGVEVRAVRDGRVSLKGAFVTLRNGKKGAELWLNNASFSLKNQGQGAQKSDEIDTSPKKLLATRKQINDFAAQKQAGFTIVPLKILAEGRFIKIVIALGKGKKLHDKRETIKRRQAERENAKLLKRW
ncbi:MAG: SsrA-binding protein SmpB [bacterium]|nr:SsrA-binding protein SmpB [bacterium]